jgi:hypothetical protein
MNTETRHRDVSAMTRTRSKGDSVKRIKLMLALGMTVAALANQACDRAEPIWSQNGSTSAPGRGLLGRMADGFLVKKDQLSLRIDLYPDALPGQPFRVDVSYRNSAGALMDVSERVTIRLGKNPTGATLRGTLTRTTVKGAATFNDLVLDKVGEGYTLATKQARAADAISAAFGVAYSVIAPPQPAAPPNAPPTAAVAISPNVPVFGAVVPGQVDYYVFHARVGEILTAASFANRLDMNSWDTSLRLRLFAPDGTTEIARSGATNPDAHGVDNGFSMVRIPVEGDYYLACDVDQQGFLSGAYAVVMKLLPNPGPFLQTENEPWGATGQNDSQATAQALLPGLLYGHFDTPANNATASDFYKIAILIPSRVRIDLTAARNGAAYGDVAWDPRLELQDASGAILWSNDNSYGRDPAIDYIITTPGTYYVRVTRSESPSNTGASPYFLSYLPFPYFSVAPVASASAATAPPIKYGAEVSGSFTVAGDQYFAFGGTAGDVVGLVVEDRTQLQGASLLMNPTSGADAVLLGTDGVTALASGSAFGNPAESKFNVRQTILQATGTYFVRVRSVTTGRFGLRLERLAATEREIEPNDSAAQATPIGASGWVSGAIGSAGDQDHFLIHAEAGQLVTVSVLAAPGAGMGTSLSDWGSALMPKLEVRSAQGAVLSSTAADRKGGFNFAESAQHPLLPLLDRAPMIQTSFRAPAAGDYDIVVSDADGQGGPTYFYALNAGGNQ